MKKIMIALLGFSSISLVACNSIQSGVAETGNVLTNTGVTVVSTTGAVVRGAGTVAKNTSMYVVHGTATLVGKLAPNSDRVMYSKRGVVYHNGHAYRIVNGRYVLAD